MSEQRSCPHGRENCGLDNLYELTLSQKILGVIGGFGEGKEISPCPFRLRDTLLAVAALLHLEGRKIGCPSPQEFPFAYEEFTKAAGQSLEAVVDAETARIASKQKLTKLQ